MKAETASATDAALMGQRLFDQALELWIRPEIERRKLEGTLTLPFALNAAQVIMPTPREKRPDYVRLNDEVRAMIRAKARRSLTKGELVFSQDIEDINAVRLVEDDEPNAGHLTMMNIGGQWVIHFDFRRDKAFSKELLSLAREYYATANDSIGKGRSRPALENLFAAAELAAKAELLLFCFYPYKNRKDHGAIRGRYAKWVKAGNVTADGNTALNRLSRLRGAARYAEGDLKSTQWRSLSDAVNGMITHAEVEMGRI